MRGTAALLLRDLLSKLHPPSPTTARESTRLLTLLDKSFRKQLDEVHPPPNVRQGPAPVEVPRPANSYLDSVLLHPLLQTKRRDLPRLASRLSAVDAFDAALRAGTLTLSKLMRIAKQYLEEQPSRTAEKPEQRLGHKITAWLAAEGASDKTAFFHYSLLVKEVVPVMYADGLEGIVWTWLRNLYQRDWMHDAHTLSRDDSLLFLDAEDGLVSEMMRMSLKQNSLRDAALQYVEASNYRLQLGRIPAPSSPSGAVHLSRPLLDSYKRLSTAILYRRSDHGIDALTFDQVLRYCVSFTYDKVVTRSILQLYHPIVPSTQSLYDDLRDKSFIQAWTDWHGKHKALHKTLLVSMLDAAQLSSNQQKTSQARFFLDFAELHWPAYFPQTARPTKDTIMDRIGQARDKLRPHFDTTHMHLAPS